MGAAIFGVLLFSRPQEIGLSTIKMAAAADDGAHRKYFQIFVKKGLNCLHSGIKSVSLADTVTDVLSSINFEFVTNPKLYAKAAKTANDLDQISIELDCPFSVLAEFGCSVIWYILPADEDDSNQNTHKTLPLKNAFDVMMTAKSLPPVDKDKGRGYRTNVHNALLEQMRRDGFMFRPSIVDSVGKKVVNSLTDVLCYIDPHHGRFLARACTIPKRFAEFQGFNDFKKKKQKEPKMNLETLQEKASLLSDLLLTPWFGHKEQSAFADDIKGLFDAICKYMTYLETHRKMNAQHREEIEPACNPETGFNLRTIEADINCHTVLPEYADLMDDLSSLEVYQPLSLVDYVPEARYKRKDWLLGIKFSFPVALYSYHPGGQIQGLHFLFKLPFVKELRSDDQIVRVVSQLHKEMPKYSTRRMRKEFVDRYSNLAKIPPALLRDMYRYLTEDFSSPESGLQNDVDQRVFTFLFDCDDECIFFDLRTLNGQAGSTKFDRFWEELDRYFNEVTTAAQERRHGENTFLPFAISVSELRDTVASRLPDNVPIPSVEWIRLQFWPKHPTSKRALQHTGRFKIQFAIQQRQLRADHEDSKFAGWQFRLLKEFAVKYRDRCLMFCLDDKAIVPIGNPGTAISTGVRGHNRSLTTLQGNTMNALDHDFHICGLIPSVALKVDIPESVSESFYQGQIYLTLKDKILSPSSPLRHGCEMVNIVRTNYSQDKIFCDKKIMINYTDGGPDHRTTYASVWVASILQFVELDLDMFVTARTAPMGSWANPAERCMSLLNLGLQNVALARERLKNDVNEKKIGRAKCLEDVRKLATEQEFRCDYKESMKPVTNLLSDRLSRLKLKGVPVMKNDPASDGSIEEFFSTLGLFNGNMSMDKLRKSDIQKSTKLTEFIDRHCKATHYVFQIKKCTPDRVESCWYCDFLPVSLPEEVFSSLHFVPDPVLTTDGLHYEPFESVYGKVTTDKDRPSRNKASDGPNERDKEHGISFVAGKVRTFIVCVECGKARVVYSKGKLTENEKMAIKRVCEENIYTCGSSVFLPDSPLYNTVVVKESVSCESPMETNYYSSSSSAFEPRCFYCGSTENLVEDDEMEDLRRRYASVRPLCGECKAHGKEVKTRGEKNVGKRQRTK